MLLLWWSPSKIKKGKWQTRRQFEITYQFVPLSTPLSFRWTVPVPLKNKNKTIVYNSYKNEMISLVGFYKKAAVPPPSLAHPPLFHHHCRPHCRNGRVYAAHLYLHALWSSLILPACFFFLKFVSQNRLFLVWNAVGNMQVSTSSSTTPFWQRRRITSVHPYLYFS